MKNVLFLCFAMGAIALLGGCKPEPVGGELRNTYWTLTAAKLNGKNIQFPKVADVSLVFSEGKYSGKAPCNSYFGEYSSKGAAISFGEIGATKRACGELEQENALFSLLSKANTYSIKSDKLELFSSEGQLTFFRMKKEKAETLRYSQGVGKLEKLFPELKGDDALHLFPILRVDNKKIIPTKAHSLTPVFINISAQKSGKFGRAAAAMYWP